MATTIAVASAASAYASAPHRSTRAAKKLTKVTIAYTAPVADQMVGPLAQQVGLFKKNGIDANIEFLAPAAALPALVSGEVQYVIVGAPNAEIDSVNGTPLEYIASWDHVLDAEIVADKSISSSQEMNGKTIAISSTGSLSDFLVQIADHQYGINMHEVPLGSFGNETAPYIHGQVDAISGTNIWQMPSIESAAPGSHIVVDFRKGTHYPGSGGMIADATWLKSKANANTTVKVLRAIYEGVAYYKTHESAAVKVIANLTSEPTSEATQAWDVTKALFTNNIAPVLLDEKDVLTALSWTDSAAASFNPNKLFNATYADEAMK